MGAPAVVILAAGEGTRMRSATPKVLHPLCGRPMIGWPVAAAQEAGAERIVVVDGPARQLAEVVGSAVEIAVQERPLGTADAVRSGLAAIGSQDVVLVLNGDHPLITAGALRGLLEAHARSGAAATLGTALLEDPSGYGRVIRAPDGTVERVVETKAPGDADELELRIREINTGIYAFDRAALQAALAQVTPANAQGELYLPDVLTILRAGERTVAAHTLGEHAELGVNDLVALAAVRAVAQRRIHDHLMRGGVAIIDPAATIIDVGVEIAPDAVIAPFTSVHGLSRIGARAVIGPHCTLIDAHAGEDCVIVHSYVQGAHVGERVKVGPFAYLRPGAVLREGAKAGAFVEIKNSEIGAGAKVPHLSYIGDAEIGERTNIGAGTITANWDGTSKHRTRIGAEAFVSVDTMLLAPVSVGDGAYTAAGSVITDDIPPGALGIARARQENKEGYLERRKKRSEDSP